jgi:hypothetical protein
MTSPARKKEPSTGEVIVAVGGLPALMVRGVDTVVLTPSETLNRTVYRPAWLYVCVGFAAVDVVPSPKVQEKVNGCPSGSVEPALEKVTASGAGPDWGLAAAMAVGGWFD